MCLDPSLNLVWLDGRQIQADLFTLPRVWEGLKQKCHFDQRRAAVAAFNEAHTWTKRGICMVPCRQGA